MRIDRNKIIKYLIDNNWITKVDERYCKGFNNITQHHNMVLFAFLNNMNVVVKIFDKEYEGTYKGELEGLRVLREASIPVPQIIRYGTFDIEGEDFNIILMERIPGKTVDLIVNENIKDLSRDEIVVFEKAGLYLKRLSDYETFNSCYLSNIFTDKTSSFENQFVDRLYNRCNNDLQQICTEVDAIWEKMYQYSNNIKICNFGWVTFGWHMKHLIVLNDKLIGIIDAEFTKKFDKAVDIGIFIHDIILNSPPEKRVDILNAVIRGYGSFKNYSSDYWERVRFYMARQAIIHVTTMYKRGVEQNELVREKTLINRYLDANNVMEIIQNCSEY